MTYPDKTGIGGKLAAGLYLVAVPIGNARDITLRALDVLRDADVLVAEDTRSLRHLMDLHGIPLRERQLLAYHDHSGDRTRHRVLDEIVAGRAVAYASEAGTPMVSDPGFDLAREATEAGLAVTTAPGVSAAISALTLAGLPTDRFMFLGFLPNAGAARRKALDELTGIAATLVFYESPKRVAAMLADAADRLGDRPAAVCRELTKKFEEIRRGPLSELATHYAQSAARGEIVVVIGKGDSGNIREIDIEQEVNAALETMTVRDAADYVSTRFGVKRRPVYQMAMRLAKEHTDVDGG
ncbi:MAG: 16S rRNA (cytidine(1402)-2'-O)-methyltransferase [Sagittula sp.]|uniref:16S rRNA (cytidine(1402)-2'-O)-methyltransferase n=1 Tax=Sagittula sp. TaxID=2038081 RepID=UPI0040598D9F